MRSATGVFYPLFCASACPKTVDTFRADALAPMPGLPEPPPLRCGLGSFLALRGRQDFGRIAKGLHDPLARCVPRRHVLGTEFFELRAVNGGPGEQIASPLMCRLPQVAQRQKV